MLAVRSLNHYFGRRGEIFITAIILIAAPIGLPSHTHGRQLWSSALIMGIGVGAKGATVPMYAAELAPARSRSSRHGLATLDCLWHLSGNCANAVVKDTGRSPGDYSSARPSSCSAAGHLIFFCPESPRWLMKKGKLQPHG